MKKVTQYDRIYGSTGLPDPVNDVIWTYYFTKAGKFDFAFLPPVDTVRNDSAYFLATRGDTIFDPGLGPYPAYKEYMANKKFDPFGHLISYTLGFQDATELDSAYNYWFLNEYWDGQVTGGLPK
ncbi:MAG: hypothetical protein JF616_02190 [Fibrobacteres bacterium]|nr:hypothetical protein [Fibrobacterota bacterium]